MVFDEERRTYLPAGQRSSIAFMISSAHRTASAIALIVAGSLFPPSNCANFRAARILAAISSTRLRPSSTGRYYQFRFLFATPLRGFLRESGFSNISLTASYEIFDDPAFFVEWLGGCLELRGYTDLRQKGQEVREWSEHPDALIAVSWFEGLRSA